MSELDDRNGQGDGAGTVPSRPHFGRRLVLVTTAALLVLLGATSGVVWAHQWWLDRPVNQALETSGDAVDKVLRRLDDAKTLEDVSAAGALAPESADSVTAAMESLTGKTSHLTNDAREVLAGQLALLEAIAPMAELDAHSLAAWGVAAPRMEEAQATLEEGASALGRLDTGAEALVPDTRAATSKAALVVGGVAVTSLTADLEKLVDKLGKVSTTKQAAALGREAEGLDDAADAVAGGQDVDTATQLEQLSIGLGAIAELAEMDPTELYAWDRNRSSLISATDSLGIDATASTASMTRWVTAAQLEVAAWQVKYDAEMARRAAATSALDTYSQGVEKILTDYEQARDEISDALEDADLDEEYYIGWEVSSAMEDGLSTRRRLLRSAQNIVPPESMRDTHQGLVFVLQAAVSAMAAGDDAIQDFNSCYWECVPLVSSSGWQEFSSGSSVITQDYDAARKAWNGALEAARAQVDAVPLPVPPEV